MFQCVPLNPDWTGQTKLDMRAIYARRSGDLAALPMRRHQQWIGKGFTYVTLADAESLALAAPFLRAEGKNPQQYVGGLDGDGRPTPWNAELYLNEQKATQADRDAEVRKLIEVHGVEAVEAIRGEKIPAHLLPETKPAAPKAKVGASA
jgi:hypothetical protein